MSFRAYASLVRISVKNRLAYLGSFLISQIFFILVLITFFSLYIVLFQGKPKFGGFTVQMLVFYLVVTESIELSKVRIFRTISEEIKDGTCAYNLLRPISYVSYHWANSMGELLLNWLVAIVIGAACATVLTGFNPKLLLGILIAVPAIWLGVVINFLVMLVIGLLAFGMEDVSPVYWVYQKVVFVLGGFFIPLDYYPAWLKGILQWLPISFSSYFPARIAVSFSLPAYVTGLAVQCGYVVLLLLLAGLIYRRGMRNVQINGG